MNSDDFGVWAMLAFWGSAVGGIVFGISWARSKGRKSPVRRELLLQSLQKRLERGELTQEEYDRRVKGLEDEAPSG